MLDMSRLLLDGLLSSAVASAILMGGIWYNPRAFLHDYPQAVRERVAPRTPEEKRLALVFGIPFMLVLILAPLVSSLALKQRLGSEASFVILALNAFGVSFFFNLVDLLVLDWLIFCIVVPPFIMIPGTEDMRAAYRDYGYHLRAAIKGSGFAVVFGLVIGGVAWLL